MLARLANIFKAMQWSTLQGAAAAVARRSLGNCRQVYLREMRRLEAVRFKLHCTKIVCEKMNYMIQY